MLENINGMKTLLDQSNAIRDTITDKQFASDLRTSFSFDKYEALITSLAMQSDNNLPFDRLKYLVLQFSRKPSITVKQTLQNQM